MEAIAASLPLTSKPSKGLWGDAFDRIRKNKAAMVCISIIGVYLLAAILASLGLIATQYNVTSPNSYAPPSSEHLLGTDIFGRDVFHRAIHGIRIALTIGFFSAMITVPIGVILGSVAGYFGGLVDEVIVWFYTTLDSIPYLLLIISMGFVLGRGLSTVCIVLGVTGWVSLCRLVRAEFMKHKTRDYVQAANALGASNARRIFLHILPNVMHLILINFSLRFLTAIKSEVILSYLGLGVEPGEPSWGVMIDDAKLELFRGVWWGLFTATTFMFFLVLAVNIFVDGLREALDPKLKNKL